ncbi:hypothetical protein CEQ90_07755 [Lewinellaceae bacterium SD302]|nr:hypothetical protein CEQ90_07755 [Lewinellaceae bacterium SD302]
MLRSFVLFFLSMLLAMNAVSAKLVEGIAADDLIPGTSVLRYDDNQQYPQYIRLQSANQQSFFRGAEWIIRQLELPAGSSLKVVADDTDRHGNRHLRLQHFVDGKQIRASQIILHGRGDLWTHATGDLYFVDQQTAAPVLLTPSQAIAAALDLLPAKKYGWEASPTLSDYPNAEILWVPAEMDFNNRDFQLAYAVKIYSADPISHKTIYLDVATGDEIAREEHIHTNREHDHVHPPGNLIEGTAETRYSGIREFMTEEDETLKYILHDNSRGNGIETYNSEGQSDYPYTNFADPDNYWNNVNPDQDEVATDVHWGTQAYYDLLTTLGRNSIDGNGELLESHLHYGNNFQNAFWDGSRMTYGDGSPNGTLIAPLVTSDVVAHELTHGLTERTAGLIYNDESGALNESFSDIFGATMNIIENNDPGNWTIGGPFTANGSGIRNMADPNIHNNPDTYDGDYWTDGAGVHTNSGVQNHWYQMLVEGETGVNDLGFAYDLDPMSMDTALEIAFHNLAFYLTPSSNYHDSGFNSAMAAGDLYGSCGPYPLKVHAAWQAVGVIFDSPAEATADFIVETFVCNENALVEFTSFSFADYIFWDFGDGSTSSEQNPIHVYGAEGSYTVTLTTYSSCGSGDTLVNTVENAVLVDPENIVCSAGIFSQNQVIESCEGALYDSGGPDGEYELNQELTYTIISSEDRPIIFEVLELELEPGGDFIHLYDGDNISAPLITSLTGDAENLSYESTGNVITVHFTSNLSDTRDGFLFRWSCADPAAPTVAIGAENRISCDGMISFLDNSIQQPDSWEWNFGDGNTSTEQNPVHTYAEEGTYDVSLTSCNEQGCNTMVFEDFVIVDFSGQLCEAVIFEQLTIQELNLCSGLVQSPGYPGNYPNNFQGGILLNSPDETPFTLTIDQFELEAGQDFLNIYDGNNPGAPQIGAYSGTDLLPGDQLTSTGSSVYLVLISDIGTSAGGFLFSYTCAEDPSSTNDQNDVVISNLKLFPNPATNRLNVDLATAELMEVTYEITDLLGHRVRSIRASSQTADGSTSQLDLTGLPAATYILKAFNAEDGRQLAVRRFVKQ